MASVREEQRQQGVENGWICVGAFAGAHGVRGDVRLKSFTDEPDAIFAFADVHKGPGGPLVRFRKRDAVKGGYRVLVDGVSNREDADALKGVRLYVPREAFDAADEDEFYLADLIGLRAVDEAGTEIGFVRAVENFGSEDLLELVLREPVKGLGRYAFVPFRKALVPVVDITAGAVTIAFKNWLETQVSEKAEKVNAEAPE